MRNSMRHRVNKDSHLSPGSIGVPATSKQLSYWMGGLKHLLNHLQAQASVCSCDQHTDWLRRHFLCFNLHSSLPELLYALFVECLVFSLATPTFINRSVYIPASVPPQTL